ncbi:MAG: GldG family protein [bacterium]|nr:GldG family protein [bacterium]MCP5068871.1 GldG family protein [bacterium]
MKVWSSLLMALGGVAFLFAVLSFLMQLLSGPVLLWNELVWSIGNLVVGLALMGSALFSNLDAFRERMQTGEARRAGKYGSSAVLTAALGIAFLGLLAFLSTRYHTHWDWTSAEAHSLSGQTHSLLAGLESDLVVVGVYSPMAAVPAKELLERYSFVSEKVKVEWLDPERQPGRLRQLEIEPERLREGLLHVTIGEESVEVRELTEEALTQAIVKLTRRDQKKVYFVVGHNERPTEGDGAEEATGFAFAAEALTNENYEVGTILLATTGKVPADADVVVVAGPTRPFLDLEHQALRAYAEQGGALLILLDPRANTDVAPMLAEWGVTVGEDVVVDLVGGMVGTPTTPFAKDYGPHPITDELRGYTVYEFARSLTVAAEAAGAFQSLVRTGADSWAEVDFARLEQAGEVGFDPEDTRGPVTMAVAGTLSLAGADAAEGGAPADPARIVVVGDADFASNQLIGAYVNRDFFVNSLNWLLGDVESISIRPKTGVASRLQLTTEDFLDLRYVSLFVLPEMVAVLGVVAWWRRRRAPGR